VVLQGLSTGSPLPEIPIIQGIDWAWADAYGEPNRYNDVNAHGGEDKEGYGLFDHSIGDFPSR
jgi:hypothetical protein